MPRYDKRCKNCQFDFEIERSYNDDSPVICPNCGSDDTRTIIKVTPPAKFVGSGFYVNDKRIAKNPLAHRQNDVIADNDKGDSWDNEAIDAEWNTEPAEIIEHERKMI